MRTLLAAALLALLLLSTSYAQTNREKDKDALVYLQISRAAGHGGTIKGSYNGMPVEGTYAGNAARGTWILMSNGVLVATGAYTCDDLGCVFSGK